MGERPGGRFDWWTIAGTLAVVAVVVFAAVAGVVSVTRGDTTDYRSTYVPATTTIAAPAPIQQRPVAAFIGDSYTQGVGAEPGDQKWTTLLSAAMNWDERNFGAAGTGYLTTADPDVCGKAICPNYQATALDAVAAGPAIVVISGGQNDLDAYESDPASVQAAIEATYTEVRRALPDARIVAVGPSIPVEPTDAVSNLDADVRSTAETHGAQTVSLLDPNVIDPAAVLPDLENVDNAGHIAISDRIRIALS